DLLNVFANFGKEHSVSLRDPASLKAFMSYAEQALSQAVNSDILLHGQRTERMFEALTVSLGHYTLLKKEDLGTVHPAGSYIAPDFRAVLKDGTQWLVEVKNVYNQNPSLQRFSAKDDYLSRMINYARIVGCQLKFALYWARWSIWTVVDHSELSRVGQRWTIDMLQAMRVNEMAVLGDRIVATKPPLRFRVIASSAHPRTIDPDGKVQFTAERAALYCVNTEITDPIEKHIAWTFMNFGDWKCSEPTALTSNGTLDAIELEWTPREHANPDQEFEIVGTLSTMFSRDYAVRTLSEEGVVQTEAELRPDWLLPIIDAHSKNSSLPLWSFVLQPNRANC
uniref:hypothetical protein n=1 Tax=Tardiphaga sp. TaxID=1926292 RepID=UPI0037D996E0